MTRDQAIEKVYDAIHDGEITGPMLIDALAALNVIKLEAPSDVDAKFQTVVFSATNLTPLGLEYLNLSMKKAGLKITEA